MMRVMKIKRGGIWGANHIDFYITDEEFDRVAKVTFNGLNESPYLTVVKSCTSKSLEPSSPLELLLLTGIDRSHLVKLIERTPR